MEELAVASGARPWRDYREDVALRVAVGKSGLSRAIVAGLAELARDDGRLEPVMRALDQFNIACQMWDDLKDWRDDLEHGMPSLLLVRVLSERPGKDEVAGAIDHVGRELYYGGHASYVLDLALAALDASDQLKRLVPELPWYRLVDVTRAKLLDTQRDLLRIIDRNVQQARAR
jgi:squalene-hopene/tetraprenyl-beta-curcumene cyclase